MVETVSLTKTNIVAKDDGPHLLITAGVHGDEFEPMAAVRQLIGLFQERLQRGRVTLVPVVNEAAFSCGDRTATDGLDLARVCPGRDNGSITEQTAAALSCLIREADYYIDLHTGGRLYDLLPLVGYVLHPSAEVLKQQRAMARAFSLPIVWGTSARLEGRSLSVARDASVPAIYTEYGGGGGFKPKAVEAYVEGCLNVAAYLNMMDHHASEHHADYLVEDDRDRSGHLQAQHPAPVAGFFEPRVKLGDTVRRGELWGEVVDQLGEERTPVLAQEDGVVLFLRAVPAVNVGDALGGILPICEPGEVRYER